MEDVSVSIEGEEIFFSWDIEKGLIIKDYDPLAERTAWELTNSISKTSLVCIILKDASQNIKNQDEFKALIEPLKNYKKPYLGKINNSLAMLLVALGDSVSRIHKVASSPLAPGVLLQYLATRKDLHIEYILASNPSTPTKVLESMARESKDSLGARLVNNPSVDGRILSILATSSQERVRALVANHKNCTRTVCETLRKDDSWVVRANIANRQDLELGELEELMQDSHFQVASIAKENYSLRKAI